MLCAWLTIIFSGWEGYSFIVHIGVNVNESVWKKRVEWLSAAVASVRWPRWSNHIKKMQNKLLRNVLYRDFVFPMLQFFCFVCECVSFIYLTLSGFVSLFVFCILLVVTCPSKPPYICLWIVFNFLTNPGCNSEKTAKNICWIKIHLDFTRKFSIKYGSVAKIHKFLFLFLKISYPIFNSLPLSWIQLVCLRRACILRCLLLVECEISLPFDVSSNC